MKERIRSAQLVALRQDNREMITLFCDIVRLIVARQQLRLMGAMTRYFQFQPGDGQLSMSRAQCTIVRD
jgi:hypothetical protein